MINSAEELDKKLISLIKKKNMVGGNFDYLYQGNTIRILSKDNYLFITFMKNNTFFSINITSNKLAGITFISEKTDFIETVCDRIYEISLGFLNDCLEMGEKDIFNKTIYYVNGE
jgi:hypothetical protein